jgi:isopentenyl diphosphate isomerase/L-lactate dehydrogenase-like FMN-dependent dehydrogenase
MNESSLQKIMIVPRVLKSVEHPDLKTLLMGMHCKYPFGFAPWAMNKLVHE